MATEPLADVTAETVTYGKVGDTDVNGYHAYPTEGPEGGLPGVIMIHEWWGLNDNIKTTARRLAGEGYRVLAVDLYMGEVATTRDEAMQLMGGATSNEDGTAANLRAANHYLRGEHGASKVGVMGWCFGGGQSLNAALLMPDHLDAAIIYYGRLSTDRDALANLSMPVLGFFGSEDGGIPVDRVRAFESTLNELEKNVEVHIYEGAGHAFANPSGQDYQEAAATDSWAKTLAFLKETLG